MWLLLLKKKESKNNEEKISKKVDKPITKENKKINKTTNKKEITLDNLTEEHLFKFMELNGSKNKEIQQLIYDNAVAQAQSGKPKEIFKVLVEVFKKNKRAK